MTVAVPVVESWDGPNRRIYLKEGVSDFYPIEDIYHEYRTARRTDDSIRPFDALLKASGNVSKGGGAFTPRYVTLLLGTKIVPFDEVLRVNQLGDMITDDPDVDPSLYDISQLTVPKVIFIKPSEAETIQLNSESIEFASYGGVISVDILSANTGTASPMGNLQYPLNNIADAHAVSELKGLSKFSIVGDLDLINPLPEMVRRDFIGQGKERTTITVHTDSVVTDASYHNATISGKMDGKLRMVDCVLDGVQGVNGYIEDCILAFNDIVLGGGAEAHFIDCNSGKAGVLTPKIIAGSGVAMDMRGYKGGIWISQKTGPESISIDLTSGQVKLDSTVVNGTIVVRGKGKLIDADTGEPILSGNYNGATIVNDLTDEHTREMWKINGLDKAAPMTVTQSSRNAGDVDLVISGDGETTSTVTRQ